MEQVILVDEHDREIGYEEKLRAHTTPKLHRAFSIFVTNSRAQMLMQRRAADKYHSAGLWSNTCCGHPRPRETVSAAASRRLAEEMGFECPLLPACVLRYRVDVGAGLAEHELNHVFVGSFDGEPRINREEVVDWRWMEGGALHRMRETPAMLTPWFGVVLGDLVRWAASNESTLPHPISRALRSWA